MVRLQRITWIERKGDAKPYGHDYPACHPAAKGEWRARVVAGEPGVTQQHVQRPWVECLRTKRAYVRCPAGQPASLSRPSRRAKRYRTFTASQRGVAYMAKRLRKKGCDTSRHEAHRIKELQARSPMLSQSTGSASESGASAHAPTPRDTQTGTP